MARPRNPSRHRAGLLPPDFLVAAAARFRALSVAARLRILDALMAGPETIGGLVRATGLEQSNLSRHVAALERAGCVRREPRGRTVVVSVSDPTLRRLCEVVCRPLVGRRRARASSSALVHPATARAMER